MNKKMKWKRLLTGFLCMVLLASNVVSVFAEDADVNSLTVSENDVSGENDKNEPGYIEIRENKVDQNEEKEPDNEPNKKDDGKLETENSTECGHDYCYTSNENGTHSVICVNCDLEETENCIFTENTDKGQICEKCKFVTEAGDDTAVEAPLLLFSLEADGYDISAADRTYTAGENITAYYFEADGTLLLEGTGEMIGCDMYSDIPWFGETIYTAIIGEGITTIGANAFSYHQELADVTLPDSLKVISDYAFCETYSYSGTKGNLRNIDIPEGVERIGEFAFRGNALEAIKIPDSVTDIGENAFADCRNAESLSIGSGVSEIKGRTFSELLSLKTIRIPGNVETIQEMAFRKTKAAEIIISDGVKMIGKHAFESCENAEEITLGNSVESIGSNAFSGCKKMKTLVIPDSVITIGTNAFISCHSLSSLTFGNGLLFIENSAFEEAYALERIEIPDNVMQIASQAFYDSRALKDISIGRGITRLGYRTFFVDDMAKTNVETENKTVMSYDWAGDGREVTFKSKVIFKDHTGNSLKELVLEHGETILDKAPAMEDYEEGGNTYVFTGWTPEITEDSKVTGGAEYRPKYSIPGKGTVTFRNYDGTVLKEVLLSYGDTILDKAPSASREAAGRNTYIFSGWSPALGETDELMGDATYTATYKRKTQTGIQVGYDNNVPEGSSISDTNIIVFPIYKVYDENNKLIEMIRNEEDVIADEDIRFSKDRIERGSNEILVEQISTGLNITAEIFGSYTDGIAVWQSPEELEAGTELKELEVYYTRTIEDKAGYIENGLIDLNKKVEKYELNESDSVTIEEGDNEIRITEKETGNDHECIVHIKGTPKKPEEDVSGNDVPDGKGDEVSGNDVPGGNGDTVSGNDVSGGKGDEVSGNDVPDGKEDDVSSNDPSSGKEEGETSTEKPSQPDKEQNHGSTDTEKDTKPSGDTPLYTSVIPDRAGQGTEPEKRGEVLSDDENSREDGESGLKKSDIVKTGDEFSPWKYLWAAIVSALASVVVWLCFTTDFITYIQLLIFSIFLKRKRKKFHGILTKEENRFIVVEAPEGVDETIQEVIDRTDSLAECMKEIRESGAVTYLPVGTKMRIRYSDGKGIQRSVNMEAEEEKLYEKLEEFSGKGRVTVRFFHEKAEIDMEVNYTV